MSLRLTSAQALRLGLPEDRPARRSGRKTHTDDGHEIQAGWDHFSEADLKTEIMKLARAGGWVCGYKDIAPLGGLVYHAAHVMSQSEKGWPDFTGIRRRDRRLIFAELKSETNAPTPRQAAVLDLLRCLESFPPLERGPTIQVFVWRPSDLEQIREILR
jgi:hypothetical protein